MLDRPGCVYFLCVYVMLNSDAHDPYRQNTNGSICVHLLLRLTIHNCNQHTYINRTRTSLWKGTGR